MKKETVRALVLLFLCSGFWVLTLAFAASFLGIGFAQGPQPPFGIPQITNNAQLPNHSQATYNMATGEVKIPFQVDTSQLLAFSVVVDNSVQTLTVLDPINQSLVVYNIYLNGPNAGKCELKSTRNISGDLKYDNYNAIKPLPAEMRAYVEQAENERKKQ
jgi:hypothetical protein